MSGSNTTMNASVVLRLQDRLSAGLGALKQRLDGIRASAERIGALGAIGSGLAIGAPILAAAGLDKKLREIAVTAGMTGQAAELMVSRLRTSFQKLALETAQTSRDVTAAAGLMMQRGLATDLIERMLPITAKVATGTSSAITDVAGVVYDLNQTLDVTPDKITRALSMLVQASREGKVELRDMAKEFPALASAAQNFGLKGLDGVKVLASAIQMAARASATPAEAATNMANLFSALSRPDTIEKIKKLYGFDFIKTMEDATKKGINPLEAAISKLMEITAGPRQQFKLKELIPDMQAGNALLPFVKNIQSYIDMRNRTGGAEPIILDQSFEVMMAGASAQIAILSERLQQLSDRFGGELFSRIASVLTPLAVFMDLIERVDAQAPDLVGNMIQFSASTLAVVAALSLIVVVLPFLATGLRVVYLAVRLLLMPVTLLVKLFTVLGAAVGIISAPVLALVAVLALIGAVAYTIWDSWEDFSGLFTMMWAGVRRILNGFILFLEGVFSLDMVRAVDGLKMMWGGLGAFFTSLFDVLLLVLEKWVTGASTWVSGKVTAVVEAFKSAWSGLTQWFSDMWAAITAPIDVWIARVEAVINRVRQLGGQDAAPAAPSQDPRTVAPWLAPGAAAGASDPRSLGAWASLMPPPQAAAPARVEVVVSAEDGSRIVDITQPAGMFVRAYEDEGQRGRFRGRTLPPGRP